MEQLNSTYKGAITFPSSTLNVQGYRLILFVE